jgi:urease accessory protein UreF
MSETTTTQPLLALLHLCDSLFPIGGFGYSDGLEAATAAGLVQTPADLRAWLDVYLDEAVRRMDGPAALRAWSEFDREDWQALCELDEEITAMRPASALRRPSRAMGVRLVTTWGALYPDRRLEHVLDLARRRWLGPAPPIAFGCACASARVGTRDAGAAFAHTRLDLCKVLRDPPTPRAVGRPLVTHPFLLGALLVAGLETSSQLSVSAGETNARMASRMLGIVVVLFSFALGGGELIGAEVNRYAFPLGVALFATVIVIRVNARSGFPDSIPGHSVGPDASAGGVGKNLSDSRGRMP